MDADNTPSRPPAPGLGGAVEPANRAPVAIERFQTPIFLMSDLEADGGAPNPRYAPLPAGADLRIAMRRTLRVGAETNLDQILQGSTGHVRDVARYQGQHARRQERDDPRQKRRQAAPQTRHR